MVSTSPRLVQHMQHTLSSHRHARAANSQSLGLCDCPQHLLESAVKLQVAKLEQAREKLGASLGLHLGRRLIPEPFQRLYSIPG